MPTKSIPTLVILSVSLCLFLICSLNTISLIFFTRRKLHVQLLHTLYVYFIFTSSVAVMYWKVFLCYLFLLIQSWEMWLSFFDTSQLGLQSFYVLIDKILVVFRPPVPLKFFRMRLLKFYLVLQTSSYEESRSITSARNNR